MKDWFARQWKVLFALAIGLDLWIILGPPIFTGHVEDLWALPLRWVVMAFGILSIFLLDRRDTTRSQFRGWVMIYFIFGFTAAGLIQIQMNPLPT